MFFYPFQIILRLSVGVSGELFIYDFKDEESKRKGIVSEAKVSFDYTEET